MSHPRETVLEGDYCVLRGQAEPLVMVGRKAAGDLRAERKLTSKENVQSKSAPVLPETSLQKQAVFQHQKDMAQQRGAV